MARKSRIFKPTIAEPILDTAGHPISIELPTPDDLIALRLANAALRKLRLCGSTSTWRQMKLCNWDADDDLTLLVTTTLPFIPLAVGASAVRTKKEYTCSWQNERAHTSGVMITTGCAMVLIFDWGLEGSFYIDNFERGGWEARVLGFEKPDHPTLLSKSAT